MRTTNLRACVVAVLAATTLAAVAPAAASAQGSISGTVTVETGGAPVNGLEVEVYAEGGTRQAAACTNAGGMYQVTNVPAGRYEVRFSTDHAACGGPHDFAPEWFSGRFSRAFAEVVTVTNGADSPNVDASLQPGARVNGTVTDAGTGLGLANITVELLSVAGGVVASACTAAGGTYSLFPLPLGVYTVRFVSPGSCGNAGNYLPQWYDNSSTQAGAAAVGLVNGQQQDGVDGRLIAGVPATLTVNIAGTGSVRSDVAGISCPDRCTAVYPVGTTVTLTASPVAGATFSGWSGGGCSGTATCMITLGGDTAVTATFVPATTPPGGNPGTGTPQPGPGPGATGNPGGGTTPAPLDVKIGKATISARRGTAKFTLTATGGVAPLRLECSLVKKGAKAKFKRCGATASYKRLKKGSYVFSVRVRDARGLLDSTPATRRFSSRRR
jgi:hypothetical protein